MNNPTPLRLLLLACLSLGCGLVDDLPGKDARCDLRPARDQCTDLRDFKGPSFITFQGVCDTLKASTGGGTFTENARCDMTGVVGGCMGHNGDGSDQTNWYYSGEDYTAEADVREECESYQSFAPPTP